MIIDAILGRKDALHYDAKAFYNLCMSYDDTGVDITRAMDGGIESEVKEALKEYVVNNDYNPLICDYIDRVNWIRGTEPTVEKAAAEEFNAACRAREEAAEKMKAPEGWESVFAFECGVLVSRADPEFEDYAFNNPALPHGFYDEDQGIFLMSCLGNEIYRLKDYVKNGVNNTYGIISFQGLTRLNSDEHKGLLAGKFDLDKISYAFFENANEVVWSCCKIDGKLIEGFLEREIKALDRERAPIDKQIKSAEDKKKTEKSDVGSLRNNLEI